MKEHKTYVPDSHTPSPQAADDIQAVPGAHIAVIGGDARQLSVAGTLAAHGCPVTLIGMGKTGVLPEGMSVSSDLGRAVKQFGITHLILPLPVTRDGSSVWCPMDPDFHLTLSAVAKVMTPGMALYGGRIPAAFSNDLTARGLWVKDYYNDEALQIKNASITAEGAIMTAMELTDHTVRDAHMAVVGYGRIGSLLSRMLVALGAHVTVYARSAAARAQAETDGCAVMPLPVSAADSHGRSLHTLCSGYDVIFNTAPARILRSEDWRQMPRRTLWVELASAPGGVDPDAARRAADETGLRVVWAPSLPGRYAPASAGEQIARLILSDLTPGGDRS